MNQFMLHQKNRNLHDKIAINLPKNLNGNSEKENLSRTANQQQLNQIRSSNDSMQLKRSYEHLTSSNGINDSTVNPCTESQSSNSYQQQRQEYAGAMQNGLPPTAPQMGRMNSERVSQNQSLSSQQQDIKAFQKHIAKQQQKRNQDNSS